MTQALRTALADELASMLAERIDVSIEGFGTFRLREYKSYPGSSLELAAKPLPYLVAAPALRETFQRAERASASFRCPALTARTAARVSAPPSEAEHALDAWLADVVDRLLASRFVEPVGNLGWLNAREKKSDGAARIVVGFVASRTLRARVNASPAPARFDSTRLGEIMASYPPAGFRAPEELAVPLARLHQTKRDAVDVPAIEAAIKQSLPPLCRALLAFTDPAQGTGKLGPINSYLLVTAAAYLQHASEHRALMRQLKRAPGIPFAVEANGDAWCFCNHPSDGDDRWVFLAGPDAPSSHAHDLRFGQWLAASLLLTELDRQADGTVLAEADVVKVLAYLRQIAPTAEKLLIDLPF